MAREVLPGLLESGYFELLEQADEKLLDLAPNEIRLLAERAETKLEAGLWPSELVPLIREGTAEELLNLHWVTETYYGRKLRAPELRPLFDHYFIISYGRVISILMAYDPNLGYSRDELAFTLLALELFGDRPPERLRILEIGSGTGELLDALVEAGYPNVYGVDPVASAVHEAKDRLARRGLTDRVSCAALEDLIADGQAEAYDVLIHSDVIEHIAPANAELFQRNCTTLLRPGGQMVVVTPNALTGPHDLTRLFKEPGSPPLGFHLREYDLHELTDLVRRAGCEVVRTVVKRPAAEDFHGGLTVGNLDHKLELETSLRTADHQTRKAIIDDMYFKGVVCEKP